MLINKIKVIGYKNHEIILLNLINLNTLIMFSNFNIQFITPNNNIVMFSNLNIQFITTVNSSKLNMYPKMVNSIVMFSSLNKYLTIIINNIVTFNKLKMYPKMVNIIKMVNRIKMVNNLNIIYMYKHNQYIKQYIQIIEHQCILKIVKHLFINQINK